MCMCWWQAFERGQTDTFRFELATLGDVERVVVSHDGTGFRLDGAGWCLDRVLVQVFTQNHLR